MKSSDEQARVKQIQQSAQELLMAIESRPGDHNGEIAARAIRAAVRLAIGDYKTAAIFASVE